MRVKMLGMAWTYTIAAMPRHEPAPAALPDLAALAPDQLLADEGKIRRVQFAGDVARYDGKLEAHEHFCCVQCDAVYDIPATLPTAVIREVEHATHGQIHQYALHYHGTCAKCLAASGAAGTARS